MAEEELVSARLYKLRNKLQVALGQGEELEDMGVMTHCRNGLVVFLLPEVLPADDKNGSYVRFGELQGMLHRMEQHAAGLPGVQVHRQGALRVFALPESSYSALQFDDDHERELWCP